MSIPETLVGAIRQRNAILFAGAGLSCTLGLPLFDVLKRYLGERVGAAHWEEFDYPALAEYFLLERGSEKKLFEWMERTWHPDNIDIRASKAHNCIVDLDFPVIYTTNYDSWIEDAYKASGKRFRKVVTVTDLAKCDRNETEIIKFHGDFDDAASIILTESSFLRRMSLEEPLDIRLRSDSLARPLLFVGYSISDPNIRYLLFRLRQLWAQYSEEKSKPKSYILMLERNDIEKELLIERGIEPIISDTEDATEGLIRFFEALRNAVKRDRS